MSVFSPVLIQLSYCPTWEIWVVAAKMEKKHMKRDSIRERKHAAVQVKTASKRVFFCPICSAWLYMFFLTRHFDPKCFFTVYSAAKL